jgi:murein DD-endopeptidase MepM/ murein hydrolase activator NlpD
LQIIVIPDRTAKAKSLTLTSRHLVASLLALSAMLAGLAFALYSARPGVTGPVDSPLVKNLLHAKQSAQTAKARAFMQENLNAMAVKLGEMQAQLARLDALGDRVSTLAGIKLQEFHLNERPGLGGAQSTLLPPQDLSFAELSQKVAAVSRQMDNHNDMLSVLEARLFEQAVRKKLMPTMPPVDGPEGSGFGVRIDPFTGQMAMHEGIDFEVDRGTPVHASAGGIVSFAGYHPQYGYMVDVDDGNDLTTRYAHLSKLLVKVGDVVQRGQKIALSGATGRATGPHLHFEVRYMGVPLDPNLFLTASNPTLPTAASARAMLARARRGK